MPDLCPKRLLAGTVEFCGRSHNSPLFPCSRIDNMPMKPGWYVTLVGDPMDVAGLDDIFREDDIKCLKEDDQWLLTAKSFEPLADAGQVQEAASELMEVVNGAMKLHFGEHNAVTVGNVIEIGADGTKRGIAMAMAAARMTIRGGRIRAVITDGSGKEVPQPPSPVVKWVRLTETDPVATEILWLLSLPKQDWFSIYKLHELMEQGGGMDWAIRSGLTTKAEIGRLTGTANNFSAAGRAARHANLAAKPMTAQPMTLKEGTVLINLLATNWLNARC